MDYRSNRHPFCHGHNRWHDTQKGNETQLLFLLLVYYFYYQFNWRKKWCVWDANYYYEIHNLVTKKKKHVLCSHRPPDRLSHIKSNRNQIFFSSSLFFLREYKHKMISYKRVGRGVGQLSRFTVSQLTISMFGYSNALIRLMTSILKWAKFQRSSIEWINN